MEPRIQIDHLAPEAYKAILTLEKYLQKSELSQSHLDLIKIRASLINGCAFCIDMHTRDALKHGETTQRLFLLNAWRESEVFSGKEKILLQVTEEITLIHQEGLTSETYQKALNEFGENYLSKLIVAVCTINVWNRIAISTHKPLSEAV